MVISFGDLPDQSGGAYCRGLYAQLSQAHMFDAPVATNIEPNRNFYPAEGL